MGPRVELKRHGEAKVVARARHFRLAGQAKTRTGLFIRARKIFSPSSLRCAAERVLSYCAPAKSSIACRQGWTALNPFHHSSSGVHTEKRCFIELHSSSSLFKFIIKFHLIFSPIYIFHFSFSIFYFTFHIIAIIIQSLN